MTFNSRRGNTGILLEHIGDGESDGENLLRHHGESCGIAATGGRGDGLRMVWFLRGGAKQKPHEDWKEDEAFFIDVRRQLQEYFAGELREFDIPLLMEGTEFQKRVWKTLQTIPYGETISYGELAKKIGDSKAVRAVGAANGQNPIPIIVPCHRVIGSDGSLTGFGGG